MASQQCGGREKSCLGSHLELAHVLVNVANVLGRHLGVVQVALVNVLHAGRQGHSQLRLLISLHGLGGRVGGGGSYGSCSRPRQHMVDHWNYRGGDSLWEIFRGKEVAVKKMG